MLFYFFFVFQIFYSISCDITCYDARTDKNSFDYYVTADHFPTELQNFTLQTNSSNCYIQVEWHRAPDHTTIILTAENSQQATLLEHKLQVEIGYEYENEKLIWEQVIVYKCHTDQCNSLSQLKRLLASLTIIEDLGDLKDLLIPVVPFDGKWCYQVSNATFVECNTTVPTDLCTQCQLIGQINQTGTELCATCLTGDPDDPLLGYGMTYNLTDQTSLENWMIVCQHDSCNEPAVGDTILQESLIDFDYKKFFNNGIERLSINNKMNLLLMIFLVKLFI